MDIYAVTYDFRRCRNGHGTLKTGVQVRQLTTQSNMVTDILIFIWITFPGSINLMNQGYEDSPLIITVFGAVENPRWDLIVNGNVIATGELFKAVTIQKGNKLVVNSEDGNLEIAEYTLNNEYVRNLYEYSNFETERFIKVPPGRSAIRIYGTTKR